MTQTPSLPHIPHLLHSMLIVTHGANRMLVHTIVVQGSAAHQMHTNRNNLLIPLDQKNMHEPLLSSTRQHVAQHCILCEVTVTHANLHSICQSAHTYCHTLLTLCQNIVTNLKQPAAEQYSVACVYIHPAAVHDARFTRWLDMQIVLFETSAACAVARPVVTSSNKRYIKATNAPEYAKHHGLQVCNCSTRTAEVLLHMHLCSAFIRSTHSPDKHHH